MYFVYDRTRATCFSIIVVHLVNCIFRHFSILSRLNECLFGIGFGYQRMCQSINRGWLFMFRRQHTHVKKIKIKIKIINILNFVKN